MQPADARAADVSARNQATQVRNYRKSEPQFHALPEGHVEWSVIAQCARFTCVDAARKSQCVS